MKKLITATFVGLVSLSLESCIVIWPRFTVRSAEVTGTVVDAKTGKPVSKAAVSGAAYHWDQYSNPATTILEKSDEKNVPVWPKTLTKPDGAFRLPRTYNFLLTKVFFAPCSGSIGDQSGSQVYRFLVRAEGYRSAVFADPPGNSNGRFDVGVVKLIPFKAQP